MKKNWYSKQINIIKEGKLDVIKNIAKTTGRVITSKPAKIVGSTAAGLLAGKTVLDYSSAIALAKKYNSPTIACRKVYGRDSIRYKACLQHFRSISPKFKRYEVVDKVRDYVEQAKEKIKK